MDISKWTSVPSSATKCEYGYGMAVCPASNLVVTSGAITNTLSVFRIDGSAVLTPAYFLGGIWSPPPIQFRFIDFGGYYSGYMAFTTGAVLLVTDAGNNAVHVIDVLGRHHLGYVGAVGSIHGPRGVATKACLAAVSCWSYATTGHHTVCLFEGAGSVWTLMRVIGGGFGRADGQVGRPNGLRFTDDGSGVAVADSGNHRVSLFAANDGSLIKQLATGLRAPFDAEECEGGWLVACADSNAVEFVGVDGMGRATLGKGGVWDGEFSVPTALALVPGLGLVVREYCNYGRVQVFVSPDMVAMSNMSLARVAWMGAVYRSVPRLDDHPLWKML